jgi:DNA-directed RNA polymerase III subunit RPC1
MRCLQIRPNAQTRLFVNLETTEKFYTKDGQEMCPADGFVCFRNRCDAASPASHRLGDTLLSHSPKKPVPDV